MARTIVREQPWSVNGAMLYQGCGEITSSASRSIYGRSSVLRSQVIKRNVLSQNSTDQDSVFEHSDRQVSYYSPSASRKINDSDNDEFEHDLQNESSDFNIEQMSNGYLLMWRKCLYFILSKPTHYDVELLSQINAFGKKKVILMLLLPILLYLLYTGFVHSRNMFSLPENYINFNSLFSASDYDYNDVSSLSMGVVNEDETLASSWMSSNDDEKSIFSLGSVFTSLFSFIPMKSAIITAEKESKLSSSINISEIEVLIRQIILENPNSLHFVHNNQRHNSNIQKEIDTLHVEFSNLKSEFKKFKEDLSSTYTDKLHAIKKVAENSQVYKTQFNEFDDKMHQTEEKIITLESSLNDMKNCCRNDSVLTSLIEHNLKLLLHSLMTEQTDSSFPDFKEWLFSKFATKEMVDLVLKDSVTDAKIREKTSETIITDALKKHLQTLLSESTHISKAKENTITLKSNASEVEMLIRQAILLYDADKTGQTDYALESGGGSIVNTRCSETFTEHSARISILGFPLWHLQNSPRNAIQPSVHPGECWAFKGSQGYLVIQLATVIKPTGFVIEHIPKSISSSGNIDSAPKDFSIHGLMSEKDFEGEQLGKYTYDKDGEPLQYFKVQADNVLPYRFIELKIHSNHGNENYTCLYRFRVHGFRH